MVFEDLSFGSNKSYAKENAGQAYLVRHWLWHNGYDYLLVAPSQIKKFATGSGATSIKKEVVIKEVLKRFSCDVNDNNMADAIVLCHIGAAFLGTWECTMQPQREVIAELKKKMPLVFSAGPRSYRMNPFGLGDATFPRQEQE